MVNRRVICPATSLALGGAVGTGPSLCTASVAHALTHAPGGSCDVSVSAA